MERAIPILPTNDLAAAKAFYVDGLGSVAVHRAIERRFDRAPVEMPACRRTFDLLDPSGNTLFVIGPGR